MCSLINSVLFSCFFHADLLQDPARRVPNEGRLNSSLGERTRVEEWPSQVGVLTSPLAPYGGESQEEGWKRNVQNPIASDKCENEC